MALIQLFFQGTQVTGNPVETELTLWDLMVKGGWVMIPIILLSFVAAYIFIERYYVIRKATREDVNFMNRIKDYIHEGKIESAVALCKS
ncbi:MAG TPA: MotA/TolQ/ExbB proton channel family protein, partial [Bacteroidales bacterium]|nr:MotA/TolQ/ExbB proton channel family protein [Bacteroidales bacterium]